ncbi:MAG: polyprenyl synthetase family protein, partial [Planctomycetota bacterium]
MSTIPSQYRLHGMFGPINKTSEQTLEQAKQKVLDEPANRFLTSTGKQIRAGLVNESYRAAGGQGQAPSQIAQAIELLHAGSLIVDDIEDDSQTRRGRPTLHREVGLPVALNIGNWFYFRSLECLSSSPIPGRLSHAMLHRSIKTIRRCHEGQALDLGVSVQDVAVNEMYSIAREISKLKTGGLTSLAAWLGAASSGVGSVPRRALARFGMSAGNCLQMKNDLQELTNFVEGDPRCDDLRNMRITWVWAWTSKLARHSQTGELRQRL